MTRGSRNELALVVVAALVGGWLALFFLGHVAGGAIHLLPLAALVLFVRIRRDETRNREETHR